MVDNRFVSRSDRSGRLWTDAAGYAVSVARLPNDARYIVWGNNKATPLASGTLASAREAKRVAARMLARLTARQEGVGPHRAEASN